jgi:hypothetical protein
MSLHHPLWRRETSDGYWNVFSRYKQPLTDCLTTNSLLSERRGLVRPAERPRRRRRLRDGLGRSREPGATAMQGEKSGACAPDPIHPRPSECWHQSNSAVLRGLGAPWIQGVRHDELPDGPRASRFTGPGPATAGRRSHQDTSKFGICAKGSLDQTADLGCAASQRRPSSNACPEPPRFDVAGRDTRNQALGPRRGGRAA